MEALTEAIIIEYPGISLARICGHLNVPYQHGVSEFPEAGYTPGAKRVRAMLQRMRKQGKIVNRGQRWYKSRSAL